MIEQHQATTTKDKAQLISVVAALLQRTHALEAKAQIQSKTTDAEKQIVAAAHELSKSPPEKKSEEPK